MSIYKAWHAVDVQQMQCLTWNVAELHHLPVLWLMVSLRDSFTHVGQKQALELMETRISLSSHFLYYVIIQATPFALVAKLLIQFQFSAETCSSPSSDLDIYQVSICKLSQTTN